MKIKDFLDKSVDLLNKGAESLGELAESVSQKIEDKRTSINKFNYLVSISNHMDGLMPYSIKNNCPSSGREQSILELGTTINLETAKLINKLLPIDETPMDVKVAIEAKTQKEYIIVTTDKKIWILNQKEYKTLEFNNIKKCEIVNKSLLTQNVNFNNNAFTFEGSEQAINIFIDLLTNDEKRIEEINKRTGYLCGITPKLQYTTEFYSGITIGNNNEVIIHENKEISHKINLIDLEYTQLLLDNTVVFTKGVNNTKIAGNILPCKKISIKFKLKTKSYVVDIMKENMISSMVKVEDSAFQNAYNLSKDIMIILDNLKNK